MAQGPLARGRALLGYLSPAPEFLVTPLLMRPVYLLSQGLVEEPVSPCQQPKYAKPLVDN